MLAKSFLLAILASAVIAGNVVARDEMTSQTIEKRQDTPTVPAGLGAPGAGAAGGPPGGFTGKKHGKGKGKRHRKHGKGKHGKGKRHGKGQAPGADAASAPSPAAPAPAAAPPS
ncbi:hypothetical protein BT63DRAFT_451462 [Microthyrium microscopicum]|uniref:Uncharacterized protein n=1 Tax=Microthyrium microscopicum TaxID=703497 RepID=A0A6A6UNX1_9PEZI|nr:hypothetical protein BT63DRAFT_451462 [Microthyrium microscopicum]